MGKSKFIIDVIREEASYLCRDNFCNVVVVVVEEDYIDCILEIKTISPFLLHCITLLIVSMPFEDDPCG